MRAVLSAFILSASLIAAPAGAQSLKAGDGWKLAATPHAFGALVENVEKAIADNKMGLVFKASASANVKARMNEDIPGNAVIGVFRPDFAKRMLAASIASGIEAPVRFYITENADKTATLSWRTAGSVFQPYMAEGGDGLKAVAAELDSILAKIAEEAVK